MIKINKSNYFCHRAQNNAHEFQAVQNTTLRFRSGSNKFSHSRQWYISWNVTRFNNNIIFVRALLKQTRENTSIAYYVWHINEQHQNGIKIAILIAIWHCDRALIQSKMQRRRISTPFALFLFVCPFLSTSFLSQPCNHFYYLMETEL